MPRKRFNRRHAKQTKHVYPARYGLDYLFSVKKNQIGNVRIPPILKLVSIEFSSIVCRVTAGTPFYSEFTYGSYVIRSSEFVGKTGEVAIVLGCPGNVRRGKRTCFSLLRREFDPRDRQRCM